MASKRRARDTRFKGGTTTNNILEPFRLLHRALRKGLQEKNLPLLAVTWANLGVAYKKANRSKDAIYNLQLSATLYKVGPKQF